MIDEEEGPIVLVLFDAFVPVLLFVVVDASGASVGDCVAVLTILFLCDYHFFPECGRSSRHDASKTMNDVYADDSSGHQERVGVLVCHAPVLVHVLDLLTL